MRTLVYTLLLVVLTLSASAQSGTFAEPAGAELDKFPIKLRPLSSTEQADLGLSVKKLEKPVVVQNHFRNIRGGRFVLETLPAGTQVLTDKNGKLRYKVDCGNRLVELVQCPPAVAGLLGSTGGAANKNAGTLPGAWSRFWNNAGKAWDSTWGGLGSALGTLLPMLLLLALLGLLGYLVFRAIQNWRERRAQNAPAPTPPAQPAAPAPPAQAVQMAAAAGAGGQNVPAVAANPAAPQAAAPAAATQQTAAQAEPFPPGRVIVDFGSGNNATRVQTGQNVARVQYERNPNDGSSTIRIFPT